jgi:hypothetical protein
VVGTGRYKVLLSGQIRLASMNLDAKSSLHNSN